MITGLTKQQHDCLKAIERLTVDGVSPSFEDLRADLGLSSKGNVHRLIHQLKERGAVAFLPGRSRSIRVIGTKIGPDQLEGLSSAELRTTAAHIAQLLTQREGADAAADYFDSLDRRLRSMGSGS